MRNAVVGLASGSVVSACDEEVDVQEALSRLDPEPGAPVTGDQAVDAALGTLEGLDALPVRDHVAVFDAVHGALSDRLSEHSG